MSPLKTIFNLSSILISFTSFSCRQISERETSETTIIVDSSRSVELNIPDSVKDINLENAKIVISNYFDEAERYYLDTVSTLSPTSLALKGKAQELRQKLLKVLPKISITTGLGEDKFSRTYYIVEGDIKLDRDELLLYSKKRLQKIDTNITEKLDNRKLTVAADRNGKASLWPPGTIIKYCIMRSSFSSKSSYDSVVKNMRVATNDWMKICKVQFEYLPILDKKVIDVETFPEPVFFIVRQINAEGAFIAQSFFPNDPSYERMLLIDYSFFTSRFSKAGVLRHELGHVLGFRHEHIWSKDGSCAGEDVIQAEVGAIPVTKYDPYSVMHYPCGLNKDNKYLELTAFDKEGALKVYPFNNN